MIRFWDSKTHLVSEIDMPRIYTLYQAAMLARDDRGRKFAEFWPDEHDHWMLNDVFTQRDCAWFTWDCEASHGESMSLSWDDFYTRFVEVTGTEEDGYQIVNDGECDVPPWPQLEWAT